MQAQATYQVVGMTCGHCVQSVTTELSRLPGVSEVAVDVSVVGNSLRLFHFGR
jgi:copper chaperone